MHAATFASNSTASAPPQRSPLTEIMPSDMPGYAAPAISSATTAGYDPILLVAALEEINARQAAIEWLLDADLLCACLA